ncbi:MAG: DNA photolyase family protein [Bacteroidales bacterium]|nr:DNA photolyase family protein [Bacteroidales bacterium]MCF8336941.1 DNA photolyase family protein [Bacteroidales bacterium]
MNSLSIFWFRRDLRLHDNNGLYKALTEKGGVLPVFIFDRAILDELNNETDARVTFILYTLHELKKRLEKAGSSLLIRYGFPREVFQSLIQEYPVKTVYANHDYEPYARERDKKVEEFLKQNHIEFKTYKDQVIFEKEAIVKKDGKPYTVFSPYARRWMEYFDTTLLEKSPSEKNLDKLSHSKPLPEISLQEMGFAASNIEIPSPTIPEETIKDYHNTRNFPADNGTTRLGVHLRFGTISIRELTEKALSLNKTYLNELIWRDFYMMILWHFPKVVDHAFKPAYDFIEWRNDETEFGAWCRGETGYPIVDAGMRELNQTGYMHNRVRMITASFLTKHLLIDWRWGERYFAEKLLDYELSSNNGGWQWAAGSGCDAAPYFRVFNPELQTKRFDPELKYIRQWVPEFEGFDYPKPIVEHKFARQRALDTYKKALEKAKK